MTAYKLIVIACLVLGTIADVACICAIWQSL